MIVATLKRLFWLTLLVSFLNACGGSGSSDTSGSISASQKSVEFNLSRDASNNSQTITINFQGDGVIAGYPPGTSEPNWLIVNAVSNTASKAVFSLTIDDSQIDAGNYTTVLRFVTGNADGSNIKQTDVNVSLNLTEGFSVVTDGAIDFDVTEHSTYNFFPYNGHTIKVRGNDIQWSISADVDWLSFDQEAGNSATQVIVKVDASAVTSNTAGAIIQVYDAQSGQTEDIPVTVKYHASNAGEALAYTPVIDNGVEQAPVHAFSFANYIIHQATATIYTSFENNIYVVDIASGKATRKFSFETSPEQLAISSDGDLMYFTLTSGHQSNWEPELQSGYIGVLDLNTSEVINMLPLDIDPYGLAVTDEHLIISGGSNQWTDINVYDKNTLEKITTEQTNVSIYYQQYISATADSQYIFGSQANTSPRSLIRYSLDGNQLSNTTLYTDNGFPSEKSWMTPDQQHLITAGGGVLALDLTLVAQLDSFNFYDNFNQIGFDTDNNRLVVASVYTGQIEAYNLNTFNFIGNLTSLDPAEGLRSAFIYNGQAYGIVDSSYDYLTYQTSVIGPF